MTSLVGRMAFRRWVVMLCLSMFIVSGFVHISHEAAAAQTASISKVLSVSSDEPDSDMPASAEAAHCHFCFSSPALAIDPSGDNVVRVRVESLPDAHARPAVRQTDTPPPRALA